MMVWDVCAIHTQHKRAGTRATQTMCVVKEWAVDDHSGHVWIVVGKQEDFWRKGGEGKEKRKSKKGGARKSGKKGETQIHFQKTHTKKKAQLTLAD